MACFMMIGSILVVRVLEVSDKEIGTNNRKEIRVWGAGQQVCTSGRADMETGPTLPFRSSSPVPTQLLKVETLLFI